MFFFQMGKLPSLCIFLDAYAIVYFIYPQKYAKNLTTKIQTKAAKQGNKAPPTSTTIE
jgi:hypothetical protein